MDHSFVPPTLEETETGTLNATEEITKEETKTEEIPGDPSHIHSFSNATCTQAAKCHCGVVKGKPLGHDFSPATCIRPKICKICGESSGGPEHVGGNATCTELPVCELCGETYGDYAEHQFDEATGIVCSVCQKVRRLTYQITEEGVTITHCEYKFLKGLEIPETIDSFPVIAIADGAFEGFSLLTSVKMPDTVTRIGERAFAGCSAMKSITVPQSLVYIGKNAFSYCSNLTEFEIPSGVSSIEAETFWSCTKLKSVTVPGSVKSIGEGAFRHCSKLERIVLPRGVESIGDKAFANCTDLKSVTISKSMKEVGFWAFSGCLSLQDVFYEGSRKEQKKIDVQLLNDFFTSAIWHYDAKIKTDTRTRT